MKACILSVVLALGLVPTAFAGENLQLNPKLDYTSDSLDGPLISGERMDDGVSAGKPAYILLYGEGCYNSKRQARRTVNLYEKYKGRVQFVIVDLDHPLSDRQERPPGRHEALTHRDHHLHRHIQRRNQVQRSQKLEVGARYPRPRDLAWDQRQ